MIDPLFAQAAEVKNIISKATHLPETSSLCGKCSGRVMVVVPNRHIKHEVDNPEVERQEAGQVTKFFSASHYTLAGAVIQAIKGE